MRENRTYGSEGGAAETNRPFLPLSRLTEVGRFGGKRMVRSSLLPGVVRLLVRAVQLGREA